MDKNPTERDLIIRAIAAARAHGVGLTLAAVEPRTGEERADAAIDLQVGDRTTRYLVAVKKGLRPATLGAALLRLQELAEKGGPVMLVADYLTPQLAEALKEQGVAFLDAAGNAYIDAPPVLVWVRGERPLAKRGAKEPQGRALQTKGLMVVFALLCDPDWVAQPYREIANIAGVAHGTVGWVMADLEQRGFVIDLQGTRRLRNRRRLLDIWVEAYVRGMRPKRLLGRYRAPARDWWRAVRVQDYGLQLGGEPAAAELDDFLRPGVATFYGEMIPGKFIADHQLRTDPDGDVELRERFWNFDYEWPWPTLVPPVLIYADLLAHGDARCIEAARRLYGTHLARLFEQD
jgi:hypothetical protein